MTVTSLKAGFCPRCKCDVLYVVTDYHTHWTLTPDGETRHNCGSTKNTTSHTRDKELRRYGKPIR